MTQILKYILYTLTIYFCQFTLPAQESKIDSLISLLKTDKQDSSKVNHANKIGDEYSNIGRYDSALNYYNSAVQLAQQSNFKKGIATSYNSIGIVSWNQGDYPKTLDYFLKALKINEEIYNQNGIATLLGNIGNVYLSQDEYQKALNYYLKALKIARKIGDKNSVAIQLGNIGTVYYKQKDLVTALDYYFKALKLGEELGDKNRIANTLGTIGIMYKEAKDYPKALEYYLKALKMKEELGVKNSIATTLGNIGSLYSLQKKYKESEEYLLKALAIDTAIGFQDHSRNTYEQLSTLYSATGKYEKAFENYKKAMVLKDALFNIDKDQSMTRKEMTYQFEKKEAATKAEQDKKNAVAMEEKHRQKIITYSVSVGLFFVLLFALFILRGYNQKQKANIIITQQKQEVENKNKIIEEKNKNITDSINYAKRIQQAKLPDKKEIYLSLPQSFVLFKPKDIVSGDFYFFHKSNQSDFIATADCTGHGVPGALMSMIGSEKLNEAISQSTDTSEILKLLNKGVKTSLRQSESEESTRDGMDIALCSIDTEYRIVKYAGANRPLWVIRNGTTEVEEIKATKTAIGGLTEDNQYFDTHEIKLLQGDTIYICTDGFADQFSGHNGKKLMTKKFKEILLNIQDKSMKEQEQYLDNFIENWKAGKEQVDDILVIGIRL